LLQSKLQKHFKSRFATSSLLIVSSIEQNSSENNCGTINNPEGQSEDSKCCIARLNNELVRKPRYPAHNAET